MNKKIKENKEKTQINPFRNPNGFILDNDLKKYKSKSKQNQDILEMAKSKKISNKSPTIFIIIFIAIFLVLFSMYLNKKNASKNNVNNEFVDIKKIKVEDKNYVSPFEFKATKDYTDKEIKQMVSTNAKIFAYITLIKDKSTTLINDEEKRKIVSYMLFYAKYNELEKNAKINQERTYLEIDNNYLNKYLEQIFPKDELKKIYLQNLDTYIFENYVFFETPKATFISNEYDKENMLNKFTVKLEYSSESKVEYISLYYLIEGPNYMLYNILIEQE